MKTLNVLAPKTTAFEFLLLILARAAGRSAAPSPPFITPGCVRRPGRLLLPGLVAAIGLLMLAVIPVRADWPNTNATKFVQLPDTSTNGMDIWLKEFPTILADDFVCTNAGPITDIHLWLSSLMNLPTTNAQFELSIWTDVPASPAAGTLSHPGVRLWSEVFGPGDYKVVVAATGLSETFWDLDPAPVLMGPDNALFQYNFYPKSPYTQTGSTANPKVYWLGVSMIANEPMQGWKTSFNHLGPDAAVLGHYAGASVTDWKTLFDPRFPTANFGLDFSFALTTSPPTNPPPQQCQDTNTVKYIQPPNTDGGWDVWDSGPWVLADDFICTNTGPITDIHIWGSWLNDLTDLNTTFWLGVYEDVPAVTNTPVIIPSHPSTNLVWQQWFGPGQYAQSQVGVGIEQFLDPGPPAVMGPDSKVFYYCFNPTNLVQRGTVTNPKIYWLAVYAQPSVPTANLFGWKSSTVQRFDISTHTPWPGAAPITTAWQPTRDPNNTPLDLAFKITTATPTNPPPPECCPETNGVKFLQRPDVLGIGDVMDINASMNLVLADDFRCTNTGPITDLHIWGSWLNDNLDPNAVFTLGIWADVPAQTNATGVVPSHPGAQLWTETYGAGRYSQCFYTNLNAEAFYDGSTGLNMGIDHIVYYLCFYPTNAFVQRGTTAVPTNYWLSVNVQTTAGTGSFFGWHSSYDHYNDVAVWGNAPLPAAWTPMYSPVGRPVSLAFKVTTATNDCQLVYNCPTNKSVPCGSNWSFDAPTASSPCCTNVTITIASTVTNGICPQIITRSWLISDCLGNAANCSQVVTVVDTTPPVLTCSPDKTVECGSIWTFDPPTALDACCTNPAVSVWSTVTNGTCPKLVTRTWLAADCCNNTNMCSQTVTVVDTTPPVINCPTNIIVTTCVTNPPVFWAVSATDNCSPGVTVFSTPPSGSLFPWGTNGVVVTAIDACGNTNHCNFLVIVQRPVLTLTYTFGPGTMKLTWPDGTLQSATNLLGPWADVPLAISPYTVSTTLPLKLYRLRCP